MKCGYKYCKFNGNVEKDTAIKDNSRYFHKECLDEKNIKTEIKNYYYEKFESKEPSQSVNGAIKKYINDQGYEAGYVLYCLKYKVKNLNSIYGLIYTLSYRLNEKEYKTYVANNTKIEYNQSTDEDFKIENNIIETKKQKGWGDLF